jgi:nucleotidyltransferase substrate binding protein (TIGR01987 family)
LQRALQTARERPLSELEEQGLIQAFEFTHELSWELLKDYLVDQGVSGISGPRDAVREAVVRELLPAGSEDTWMAMIRSRNLTSHTYNPELAREIAAMTAHDAMASASIAGLPQEATERILALLAEHPSIQRVVLYGSRALGRHRPGSDIDLCLEAPDMGLAELLLPWRIDLQLRHLIRHPGLLDHIDRVGITLATPRPASGQGQDVWAQR